MFSKGKGKIEIKIKIKIKSMEFARLFGKVDQNITPQLHIRRKFERDVDIFAQVVLLSDNYLMLKKDVFPENHPSQRAHRFFRIMIGLPLELQMMICKRIYFSMGTVIYKGAKVEPQLKNVLFFFENFPK